MEKMATEATVWTECDKLKEEGRKVTARAVQAAVGGGSLSTVLRYIKTWEQKDARDVLVAADIPAELQETIRRVMGSSTHEATESLRQQIEESAARESEALDGLARYEEQIASYERELADSRDRVTEAKQSAEKASAVASVTIAGLKERIEKLEQENDLLIRSGEAARTESAKAILQVERADLAAGKAESRVLELEKRVSDLVAMKAEAEKGQAVAEQHAQDLKVQLVKSDVLSEKDGEKIIKLESERDRLTQSLTGCMESLRKAEGAGEQMNHRIQESAATVERLQKALDLATKVA